MLTLSIFFIFSLLTLFSSISEKHFFMFTFLMIPIFSIIYLCILFIILQLHWWHETNEKMQMNLKILYLFSKWNMIKGKISFNFNLIIELHFNNNKNQQKEYFFHIKMQIWYRINYKKICMRQRNYSNEMLMLLLHLEQKYEETILSSNNV